VIQRAVKELSNHIIEFLDAVQLDGNQFARGDAITGKDNQAMVTDESAEVCLCEDYAVHDLAKGNPLAKTRPSPFLIFLPYRLIARIDFGTARRCAA
jgi:hypothetical protein